MEAPERVSGSFVEIVVSTIDDKINRGHCP